MNITITSVYVAKTAMSAGGRSAWVPCAMETAPACQHVGKSHGQHLGPHSMASMQEHGDCGEPEPDHAAADDEDTPFP